MNRTRLLVVVVLLLAILFAVQGGEYSTGDWLSLRKDVQENRAELENLRRQVDSLREAARLVETDSATQERIAREEFGMIREGEILYRILPADSSQ